jgi:hypothetical protein
MADVPISRSSGQPDPIRKPDAVRGAAPKGAGRTSEKQSDGIAFKALLERLEEKARALEETTRGVDDAAHLAGAVEGARASLEDALSLGEELLESYRQNRHQSPTIPKEEESR